MGKERLFQLVSLINLVSNLKLGTERHLYNTFVSDEDWLVFDLLRIIGANLLAQVAYGIDISHLGTYITHRLGSVTKCFIWAKRDYFSWFHLSYIRISLYCTISLSQRYRISHTTTISACASISEFNM